MTKIQLQQLEARYEARSRERDQVFAQLKALAGRPLDYGGASTGVNQMLRQEHKKSLWRSMCLIQMEITEILLTMASRSTAEFQAARYAMGGYDA